MAKHTTDTLATGTWTQLTNANVSAITFENLTRRGLYVQGTVGASPPSNLLGAAYYDPGMGEKNIALTDLFPGVSGANRVYGYVEDGGPVFVSHA